MASRKVIISCAVTGSIHTPSMSPHLPVTAAEIASSALAAAEAGAAIVHLHARDPKDGRPDQSPEAFEPFLRVIKQNSNVVVNLTTGGSPYMTVEERVKPAAVWKPEIASLNMGSMNFGLFPMLKRFKTFKHDWEPAMLEGSRDLVFRNSFKDIRYALETLNDTGARYEFECYDTSHLYNLHYFWTEGLVKAPLFIQTVFGLLGGIGPHPDDVMHMKRTADRLFGENYSWSVLGAGRAQPNATLRRRWFVAVYAACVIGGLALTGGRGSILGVFLGAALIYTIQDVLLLLRAPGFYLDIFVGALIVLAVILNQAVQGKTAS